MSDPWRFFTPKALAAATECPPANVREHWPRISSQLDLCGINDRLVQIAAAGTVAKESASTFAPVREAYWLDEAARWAEYTRRGYGGGPEYHGRGFIQITHLSNYRAYTTKLAALWGAGPDLVAHPDMALDPDVAAAVTALYFRDTRALPTASWPQGYSLTDAAHAQDWEWVRRLVYGGADPDGAARIGRIAATLGGTTMPTRVTYNASEPAHPQDKSFDCSQEALEWALHALGRKPADAWLEQTMIAEGVMSKDLGLLDASGAGLAAFVSRHYGEFGYYANHEPSVTFDGVALEGDHAYPLLIGGRKFGAAGHWVGVRDYDPSTGLLHIANPANGYDGIEQTLSRAQFEARGPWSMVRVLHNDLLAAPEVPAPADPTLARIRALTEEIAALTAQLRAKVDELSDLAA